MWSSLKYLAGSVQKWADWMFATQLASVVSAQFVNQQETYALEITQRARHDGGKPVVTRLTLDEVDAMDTFSPSMEKVRRFYTDFNHYSYLIAINPLLHVAILTAAIGWFKEDVPPNPCDDNYWQLIGSLYYLYHSSCDAISRFLRLDRGETLELAMLMVIDYVSTLLWQLTMLYPAQLLYNRFAQPASKPMDGDLERFVDDNPKLELQVAPDAMREPVKACVVRLIDRGDLSVASSEAHFSIAFTEKLAAAAARKQQYEGLARFTFISTWINWPTIIFLAIVYPINAIRLITDDLKAQGIGFVSTGFGLFDYLWFIAGRSWESNPELFMLNATTVANVSLSQSELTKTVMIDGGVALSGTLFAGLGNIKLLTQLTALPVGLYYGLQYLNKRYRPKEPANDSGCASQWLEPLQQCWQKNWLSERSQAFLALQFTLNFRRVLPVLLCVSAYMVYMPIYSFGSPAAHQLLKSFGIDENIFKFYFEWLVGYFPSFHDPVCDAMTSAASILSQTLTNTSISVDFTKMAQACDAVQALNINNDDPGYTQSVQALLGFIFYGEVNIYNLLFLTAIGNGCVTAVQLIRFVTCKTDAGQSQSLIQLAATKDWWRRKQFLANRLLMPSYLLPAVPLLVLTYLGANHYFDQINVFQSNKDFLQSVVGRSDDIRQWLNELMQLCTQDLLCPAHVQEQCKPSRIPSIPSMI